MVAWVETRCQAIVERFGGARTVGLGGGGGVLGYCHGIQRSPK